MINKLRSKVSEYMTRYSDMDNWENIRQNYSFYSYITFLVLALNDLDNSLKNIKKSALEKGLEEEEILDFLFGLPGAELFTYEIVEIVEQMEKLDVNAIYQEFISVDFIIDGHQIVFSGGKNSRDILGSYFTREDFAYEVVKKAIDDYILSNDNRAQKLRVADLSCGGGAFLVAAYQYCIEKNIKTQLYGVDVDPIAVMIARARLICCCKKGETLTSIKLGNPLINETNRTDMVEVFKMASNGRFYNQKVGINIDAKFDVVVGNPPWEKIRFEEKKFLQHFFSKEKNSSKFERAKLLKSLTEANRAYYYAILMDYEFAKKQLKKNAYFSNTNCGELNTYALFTELSFNMLNQNGISGLIVKSSLVKMPVYSKFMRVMIGKNNLYELYMFINRKKIFNIDSREEFSVIYLKINNNDSMRIALDLEEYVGFYNKEKIMLSYDTLDLINPDTGMIPNIKNNQELQFLINVYSKHKILGDVYNECKFGRLVHLTNHSAYILNQQKSGYEPIYEGKFIELYTGKYATFNGMSELEKYKNKATARPIEDIKGEEYPEARYYIERGMWNNISKNFKDGYIIAWRSLTSATNRRTMLATVLPLMPTCQSIQMLQVADSQSMLHILALFNSIVFDYIIRLKMVGLDLTQTIIRQIPVPEEREFDRKIVFHEIEASISIHISSRLYILYKNDVRVKDVFEEIECYEIRCSTETKKIICEIDMLIAIVYGMDRDTLREIACSFNQYYTREEVEKWF